MFSSMGGGPFDWVNFGNLNVHFAIPVLHKAGRGVPFTYDLAYDSSVWTPVTSSGVTQWQPVSNWGWTAQTAATSGYVTAAYSTSKTGTPTCNSTIETWSNYLYHDPIGRAHPFAGTTSITITWCNNRESTSNSGPLIANATDGSGFSINSGGAGTGNWTITSAKGTVITGPYNSQNGIGTYTDANGNQVSVNSSGQYFDTLSSSTPALTMAGSGSPSSPTTFTYVAPSGQNATVTVNYTPYTVATNFGFTSSPQIKEYGPASIALVSSIALPDGTSYTFSYEATPGSCTPIAGTYAANCVTGRITEVTLPTGGSISYSYMGGPHGTGIFSDGSTAGIGRTLSTGGSWSYSRANLTGTPGPGSTWSTTITDPAGNETVSDFSEDSTTGTAGTYNLYETQRQVYQGSPSPGNLLQTVLRCYKQNFSNCTGAAVGSPITSTDTYTQLPNGMTRLSEVYYNGSYLGSGLVSIDNEYDFGVAQGTAPGTAHQIRQTQISYASLGNGLIGYPSSVAVYDYSSGSGVLFSSTSYNYDQTAVTSTNGTPQHILISGARGNLTTASYQTSSSSTLTRTYTYYDTGNLNSAMDVNGATTTYGYGSSSCGNSFVTSISEPLSLSRTATWNCAGGVIASVTDENGNPTSLTYNDPFLRPTEIDNPDGGKTTYGYSPTQTSVYGYQNSSVHTDTELLVDGLGRPSRIAVANGQGSNPWYQVDACYDSVGNLSFSPYVYQGNGWGTGQCSTAGDTFSHDALGRLTKMTHSDGTSVNYLYVGRATQITDENGVIRIVQVDGTNRPTAVCEISSNSSMPGSGSPSSCGMDIAGTGFLTTYSYSLSNHQITLTQGAQSRVFQTDWVGRPILVREPESGQTTYSYAYNGTGLAVTRVRPQANQTNANVTTTTTTQYDALGRVVSINYSDGTPAKSFSYDASAGWGAPSQTNLKGRLSRASVSNAQTIFSYDSMSRVTAMGECAPSNCGSSNYVTSYTYDWVGNLQTSTDGSGTTDTYVYSPANEVQSITSSLSDSNHPPNLLSNVQSGPFGPLGWQLGNGLNSVKTYDTLGRNNGGWVCNGSSSAYCSGGMQVYGYTLSWSGSHVTGECDTVLNQCMTFGYDEFNRLASRVVTSGTSQNFTYVYDRWGNRWQQNVTAGSGPSPNLIFNTANNQISASGYTYDAAGNLMSDVSGSYTYDAEGNITKVNSGSTATYTYDALNHRARIDTPSSAEEFIFNPAGQHTSAVNPGQWEDEGWAYWGSSPLAFYSNGTTQFEHQDWLGTERMRTDVSGNVAGGYISLPFGDGYTVSGNDWDAYHFAGLDQDSTSNDHAQFRQYSNIAGRWLSPDPYGGSYDFTNPQSMNRYAYVANNPLSYVDPTGLNRCGPNCSGCDPSQQICGGGDLGFNNGSGDFCDASGYCGAGTGVDGFGLYGPGGVPWNFGPGYIGTVNPLGAGLSAYLSSIPWYRVQGGDLMLLIGQQWVSNANYGATGPNGAIDLNLGMATSLWADLGELSGFAPSSQLSPPGVASWSSVGAPNNATVRATPPPPKQNWWKNYWAQLGCEMNETVNQGEEIVTAYGLSILAGGGGAYKTAGAFFAAGASLQLGIRETCVHEAWGSDHF